MPVNAVEFIRSDIVPSAVYDLLLVPTDGSTHAEAAAETAFDLAETTGAQVAVVGVADLGPFAGVTLPGDDASAEEVLSERAREFVDRLAARADERGLEVRTAVRRGSPVQEILEYAEDVGADAVVMGSKGRGGVGRLLLGSVTDGVIRYGDVDVLVAGDAGEDRSRPS